MSDEEQRTEAISILDAYIGATLDGFIANARSLATYPADRATGARVRSHLVDLERFLSVRNGLR